MQMILLKKYVKVVISTLYLGDKKLVFLWPLSQYEVWDHKIWGERTSDRSFHGPNVKYTVGSTCSQQALPKTANFWKNDLFNNFEVRVVKLKTRKWALTSGADIFTSFEYFHMKKGTQKVEISDFRFMYYIKWSLTVSILSEFVPNVIFKWKCLFQEVSSRTKNWLSHCSWWVLGFMT